MGDDDWDLYAVVRSCKPAVITTAASSSPKAAHHRDGSAESPRMWDYVKRQEVMTYDPPPVGFPNLDSSPRGAGGAFQGLEEFYQPFLPKPSIDHHTNMTTATATTATSSYAAAGSSSITIIPNSPTSFMSDFGGGSNSSSGQHQLQQQQQNNFLPANSALSPHFNPGFSPVSGFGRFLDRHQQPQLETLDGPAELLTPRHKGTVVPFVGPPMPTMQIPPQIIRPKKRNKNQIKKMVCRLTADNLSSDMWAWRKYGQKPIKGSPHPRNYYRCSSTKGCSARKQVERSVEDPDVFVVTYAGDHSHPRPTHRNSLAGSTRNKSASTLPKAKVDGQGQCEDDDEAQAANKNQNSGGGGEKAREEAEDEEIEEEEDDDDEGASMTSEDIFLGMKQLGRTGSGGSTLGSLAVGASGEGFPTMTSNLRRTSWGTNCSLSAGATVDGCGLLGN